MNPRPPCPSPTAVPTDGSGGSRRGFTLVELLVVVAVVSVLAGLLLPALARSRAVAGSGRCLSNQRQLGLSAQLYWDDHGGRAFPERRSRTNGGWNYWFGWLADGAEGQRAFDPTQGALWPYLQGRAVTACPALARSGTPIKAKAVGAAFGYGYNLLVGTRTESGIRLSTVSDPSGLALFTDCAQVNDFQAPASPEHPMLEEFYYFDLLSPTVHFRHRGASATAFVDGHAAAVPPKPGSQDLRLPGEVLGTLRDEQVRP